MKKLQNMNTAELAQLIQQAEARRQEIEAADEGNAADNIASFLAGRNCQSLVTASRLIKMRKWQEGAKELSILIAKAVQREADADKKRRDRRQKTAQKAPTSEPVKTAKGT